MALGETAGKPHNVSRDVRGFSLQTPYLFHTDPPWIYLYVVKIEDRNRVAVGKPMITSLLLIFKEEYQRKPNNPVLINSVLYFLHMSY